MLFERESELVERCAAHAYELFPAADHVATEMASRAGIADLVIARADRSRVVTRTRSELEPVTLPGAVQLLAALSDEESAPELVFLRAALQPDYGHRLLRVLSSSGHARAGASGWRRAPEIVDAYDELIAIEAKLSDWGRALTQAVRYLAYADYAYVALPRTRADLADHRQFAVAGVGLIGVDEDRAEIVLPAPRSTRIQAWRRLLVSETLAAQLKARRTLAPTLRGRESGSRPPDGFLHARWLPAH